MLLIENSTMEMRLPSMVIVSVLAISILTACAWKLLCLVWLKPKKLERCLRQQGIRGTPYRLLFQDLRESLRVTRDAHSQAITPWSDDIVPRVLPFTYHSIQKYGKVCFTWIGPMPVLNIMDAAMVKEILSKSSEFEKPRVEAIGNLLASGLLMLRGEKWAKHRRIINPAFHMDKMKHVVSAACSSCEEMVSQWEKQVIAAKDGSCEVDVSHDLEHLSGDVISRAAFGSNYEEGKEIFLLQKEQIGLTSKILQLAFIPGWSLLPTRLSRRMKRIDSEVRSFLKCIVTKREKEMKEREGGGGVDLLGLLLRSNLKEIQESKHNEGISIDEVIEECKTFYLAGQDTTSNFLAWTLILLSKHQDWQAKARQEVLHVFGDNKPHFDGLQRLKIVSMILNEVLRLYTPSVMTIRAAEKPTKLRDIVIPPGVQLFLPMLLIHRDRQLWGDDAEEFKPERFSEGVSRATRSQSCFLPFGWGPRTCIGQNFALLEAKVVLAMILQSFSMELSPSYKHAPRQMLTLQPQFGAPLILRKVKSS